VGQRYDGRVDSFEEVGPTEHVVGTYMLPWRLIGPEFDGRLDEAARVEHSADANGTEVLINRIGGLFARAPEHLTAAVLETVAEAFNLVLCELALAGADSARVSSHDIETGKLNNGHAFVDHFSSADMIGFAADLGYSGPPFAWDPDRRATLRSELDAALFHVYGLASEDVEYVLSTFPIVRRNDEKEVGFYRTRQLVLNAYDQLQAATETGGANGPFADQASVTGEGGRSVAPRLSAPTAPVSAVAPAADELSDRAPSSWRSEFEVELPELLVGMRVRHTTFGVGRLVKIMGGKPATLRILFRDGEHTIAFGYGKLDFSSTDMPGGQ
jgi:hypothetical protein